MKETNNIKLVEAFVNGVRYKVDRAIKIKGEGHVNEVSPGNIADPMGELWWSIKRILKGWGRPPKVYVHNKTIDLDQNPELDITGVYIFNCKQGETPYPAFTMNKEQAYNIEGLTLIFSGDGWLNGDGAEKKNSVCLAFFLGQDKTHYMRLYECKEGIRANINYTNNSEWIGELT